MTPQQLKNSILQLAVQGKLVEQRPEEGTGEELYKQIQAEKQRLIKEGKIKKEKPLEEIREDEIPFDIPDSWKWVRISSISSLITKGTTPRGGNVTYSDSGIGFIRAENVSGLKRLDLTNLSYIDEQTHAGYLKRSILKENDVLITIAGTLGRTAIVKKDNLPLNANQAVAIVRLTDNQAINLSYLVYALNAPTIQEELRAQKKITAIPNLTLEIISDCLIPIPPIKEQQRIVAKIEELMPLVEQYEVAYNKLEALNKKFPEDMQKAILQYAVQGKLVEQRPEEGTGEELYKQIQMEKQKLIKEGKIKKEKPLEEIKEDEISFDIPDSWKWVKLGDISTYAETKQKINASIVNPRLWGLDLEDIEKGGKLIVKKTVGERKAIGDKTMFFKGDILYSKLRPYLLKILIADEDGVCSPEIVPFKLYGKACPCYITNILKSPYVDNYINGITYGIKMPRVGTDTMKTLLIPLPPLGEQQRIVAKIEELMPLVEKLKEEAFNLR